MSGSSRDNSNDLCRIFVKGAEQVTVSKKRARDVNTARGAAAFTAEESTSSYGNFGGLPSNFQSRTPSGRNSQSLLGSSSRPLEASGNNEAASVRSDPLPESNIGFQLLKKSGWKEGTGLGVVEQGRLDPVESYLKQDRRGIGADLKKNKSTMSSENRQNRKNAVKEPADGKKEKVLSKKAKKADRKSVV